MLSKFKHLYLNLMDATHVNRIHANNLCPAPASPCFPSFKEWCVKQKLNVKDWVECKLQSWYEKQCAAITAEYKACYEGSRPEYGVWRENLVAIQIRAYEIGAPSKAECE